MRVFVTGASGFIGSAVVRELISAGHQVTGLARSDKAAAAVTAAGAAVHQGTWRIRQPARRAATADGVIHTAFNNVSQTTTDVAGAIEANVTRSGRSARRSPLGPSMAVTSGTALIAPGHVVTEEDVPEARSSAWRLPRRRRCRSPGADARVGGACRCRARRRRSRLIQAIIGIARDKGSRRTWATNQAVVRVTGWTPRTCSGWRWRDAAGRGCTGRQQGHPAPRHRRRHRPAPEPAGDRHLPRGGRGPLRLDGPLRPARQPRLQHPDPAAIRLEARAPRADPRPRRRPLLHHITPIRDVTARSAGVCPSQPDMLQRLRS